MIMVFILENENRMGAQTRGPGSGIRTNHRETEMKSINRNKWMNCEIGEIGKGLNVMK